MILLPSLVLLTARHDCHGETPADSYNHPLMTGNLHPVAAHTAYDSILHFRSVVSDSTHTLATMTASAMLPGSCHSGHHGPYTNGTSTKPLSHSTVPSSTLNSSVTSAWSAPWSLHWSASGAIDATTAVTTTALTTTYFSVSAALTNATPDMPLLTSRPAQPSPKPSTVHADVPITTMSAVILSSVQSTGMFDSIIFDPGRLSNSGAQTSAIHITITASMSKATPTTTMVKDSTTTSQVTSTLTKIVRPPWFIQSASAPPPASPSSAPQLSLTSSSSIPPQSGETVVRTSIVSRNPRCPYPFPGVYCGEPKTTLITETRSGRSSTTHAPSGKDVEDMPKESVSCPYPGMKC